MTWQEELRQLDSALAGGELAANEYRKRRDEILAAASSAQPPSPVIGPPTGPRPAIDPESDTGGDEKADNKADASGDNGDNSGDNSDNGEVTQIVNVDDQKPAHDDEADSTQIISDPARSVPAPQAVNEEAAADRTQVITAGERQVPAPVPAPQGPWAAHRPDPQAPTSVFPRPPQPMPPAVTPMDAQDLFTSNKAPRGTKKPWLVAVVVLVVLALAGTAIWWFALRDEGAPNTADTGPSSGQQPTDEPVPPVDITSVELPGEAAKNGGEMDIAKAGELKVIAPPEAALLADAGVGAVVYSGSSDGNYRYLLYSYPSDDAGALTDAVSGVQEQMGLKPATVDGVPDGVEVTGLTNSSAAALRALYTYGDTTIQLCVLQVPTGDAAELGTQFAATLKAVTDTAPPTR